MCGLSARWLSVAVGKIKVGNIILVQGGFIASFIAQ